MGGRVKKISNPGLLKRNKQVGNYAQLAGMAVLIGGVAATYFLPERLDLSYLALILGFVLVTVGSSFTNRWGRIPPPDQVVDDVLKVHGCALPARRGPRALHAGRSARDPGQVRTRPDFL
jgi:hypothetical protein